MAAPRSERPRSRSLMSLGSHKSSNSVPKIDLTETSRDKKKMHTKADPTMAISEAQPATQALDKSTMESIRNLQHRDMNGNLITDPDLSNPTRPRLERPLDTIRSFEAAIDGSYNKRFSTRAEAVDPALAQSRRSSYFMGFNNASAPQRFPGDTGGYHGHRISYQRPDSYMDHRAHQPGNYNRPDSYIDNRGTQAAHYVQPHPRQFGPRNHSDPALYGNNSHQTQVYPAHGYQQSYDTVTTTGSGTNSQGTDQWGNSTDPSSENSSIDRIPQVHKPDLGEVYGFNGFGGAPHLQGPILEEFDQGSPTYGQPGYGQGNRNRNVNGRPYQGNGGPPPPPRHGAAPREIPPPVPVKMQAPNGRQPMYANGPVPIQRQESRTDKGEKRQSWLKRRFSKKG